MLLWHTEGTEGTDTEGTEGTVEGGKMVLPAILAVAGVTYASLKLAGQVAELAVAGVEHVHDKAVEHQRMVENERYWNDYERNTGVKVKYPHRAGAYTDWVGYNLDYMHGVVRLYNNALRLF